MTTKSEVNTSPVYVQGLSGSLVHSFVIVAFHEEIMQNKSFV